MGTLRNIVRPVVRTMMNSLTSRFGGTLSAEALSKLIGYWDFTKDNGTYIPNEIGFQDRTAAGGQIYKGRGMAFDGNSSQYAETHEIPDINFGNFDVSYSFWIKTTAPSSSYALLFGKVGGVDGSFYASMTDAGRILFVVRGDAAKSCTSSADHNVVDGDMHHICVTIDRSSYMTAYVDGYITASVDISTVTFSASAALSIRIGGSLGYYQDNVKYIKDVRLFKRVLTADERDALLKGQYVANFEGWWPLEDTLNDQEFIAIDIGGNDLELYNSPTVVEGPWHSVYNIFGYHASDGQGSDLLEGDGAMTTDTMSYNLTAWTYAIGQITFNDIADQTMLFDREITITKYDFYYVEFDIETEGTAQLTITQEGSALLFGTVGGDEYAEGHHKIIFQSEQNGTQLGVRGFAAGDVFVIKNIVFGVRYQEAPVYPNISGAIPSVDIFGRALTFRGQAKYPLLKVDADTVVMPDEIGELVAAAEEITVNSWYESNGEDGAEIDIDSIAEYEEGKQYYGNNILLITRSGETYIR